MFNYTPIMLEISEIGHPLEKFLDSGLKYPLLIPATRVRSASNMLIDQKCR
jgi:hypothetical protein